MHRIFTFRYYFSFRFRGVHHAFAKILSEGGIRGLWAGWVPNIQRAALVNMGGNGNFIELWEVLTAFMIVMISTDIRENGKLYLIIFSNHWQQCSFMFEQLNWIFSLEYFHFSPWWSMKRISWNKQIVSIKTQGFLSTHTLLQDPKWHMKPCDNH